MNKSLIDQVLNCKDITLDTIGMSGSKVMFLDDKVLKIQPVSTESENERLIMDWLKGELPVPEIIAYEEKEGLSYLLMSRVPGVMCCDLAYINDPNLLVDVLCDGLKRLWSIDVSDCPCDNRLDQRLRRSEEIVRNGMVDMENVDPATFGENGFKDPKELLQWLVQNRPKEDIVLSHGDFCLPNIFACGKRISGYIDLGKTGLADRYQDLAICYRSLRDNLAGAYGGHTPVDFKPEIMFERLGIKPDWDKIRYFMLLDELF